MDIENFYTLLHDDRIKQWLQESSTYTKPQTQRLLDLYDQWYNLLVIYQKLEFELLSRDVSASIKIS